MTREPRNSPTTPLPKHNATLRQEVQDFAIALELRLRKNDHKGGWQDMTPTECLSRAYDEMHELWKAVGPNYRKADPRALKHEAEDAANFLLFLWHNSDRFCDGVRPL